MRPVTSTFVRTQVRAYFITLNTGADHLAAWHEAAAIEGKLAERRIRDAARRADKRHQVEVAELANAPAGTLTGRRASRTWAH